MNTYNRLLNIIKEKGAAYLILIDPDNTKDKKLEQFVKHCSNSGVDGFLVGGSLLINGDIESCINIIKKNSNLPAIIFPGNANHVYETADGILFLSVISGRNPEHLIGKQVLAAPLIKKTGIEPLPTGYILIESGIVTTVQYMDGSLPIPANKPELAVSTALAGEYLGMKLIYLEAGSGAQNPVPDKMVRAVTDACTIPVIVGGGIKNPDTARNKVKNGAKIIVTGNFFEHEVNWNLIKDFAEAVHIKSPVNI